MGICHSIKVFPFCSWSHLNTVWVFFFSCDFHVWTTITAWLLKAGYLSGLYYKGTSYLHRGALVLCSYLTFLTGISEGRRWSGQSGWWRSSGVCTRACFPLGALKWQRPPDAKCPRASPLDSLGGITGVRLGNLPHTVQPLPPCSHRSLHFCHSRSGPLLNQQPPKGAHIPQGESKTGLQEKYFL